jgi:superfamily II DNA or RNA helicase
VSVQLRDYQIQLLQAVLQRWHRGQRRLLVQLPTGGGKTILFGAIAQEFLARGERVLILAHREELITQAAEKVSEVTAQAAGIIKAGYPLNLASLLQVASVQTLVRRLGLLQGVGMVVVDEAHHASAESYRKVLAEYADAYLLGVTATPIRTDGAGFEGLFDELVCGPTVDRLIASQHLCPFKLFADSQPMQTQGVRTTGGDFNPADLIKANSPKQLSGNLLSMWQRFAPNKRTVVFAINVAHSEAIAARYCEAGIPAEHLDGNTPVAERRAILARFAQGETLVLTNCDLISEGFDLPAIEAVQIARPTQSLALWLQQVGRALRPHPGKDCAILLDHTRNWLRHGLPTQPRTWTLRGVFSHQPTLLTCPTCNFAFELPESHSVQGCCHCPECGTQIGNDSETPAVPREVEREPFQLPPETANHLEEVSPTVLRLASEFLRLQELLDLREKQDRSADWVADQLADMNPDVEVWQSCARSLGRSPDWALQQYRDCQALQAALTYEPVADGLEAESYMVGRGMSR